jgi:hypothetical protein
MIGIKKHLLVGLVAILFAVAGIAVSMAGPDRKPGSENDQGVISVRLGL